MLAYIFKSIIITSLIGTVTALFLMSIKPITRKFFSRRWNYYVWLVVLIAMIVPFRFAEQETMQQSEANTFYSPIQEFAQGEPTDEREETPSQTVQVFEKIKLFVESKIDALALIWLFGVCVIFLLKLITYGNFLVKFIGCTEVISCPEIQNFTDRKIITRVSDEFSSPFMVGVFKPTLLLPKVKMTDEQFENVLSHEMIHFKRKDILYKWFVCIVKCVHWFNPIIYYISKQVDIECEISCDAEVVKDMSDEQQTRYIDTIITLIGAGNKKAAAITTGMASDKKTLQRRFTMIKKKMKISKKAMAISIVLVIAVIGGTVCASGVINGKMVDDADRGDVAAAAGEAKLILNDEPKKISQSQTTVDVDVIEHKEIVLEKIEFDTDIRNNPVDGEITMNFGKRKNAVTKEVREHNGVDIKAPEGSDVVTSITGTVTDVGFNSEKGNYVVVENGNVKTLYAQLATTSVKKGDEVTAKQVIGTVGKTGRATGTHLHFEMMVDGEYVDPTAYMK